MWKWPGLRPLHVIHSLPGRVRLRLAREDRWRGPGLAEALAGHPAVAAVRWSQPNRSLTLRFDPAWTLARLAQGVRPGPPREQAPHERGRPPLWRRFLLPAASLALAASGPGLVARVGIALCALPIARRAARSAADRRLTIDVLDTTAVGLLLATGDVLAAGVSVALVETGERMRQAASGRARRVLHGWIASDSREVRVQRGGSEPRVALDSIVLGERVVIYAGEAVPVDGQVISGSGSLDSRTWTGEWRPAAVGRGASLLAGTTLVDGRVVIRVTATGEETRAGRLAAAIEDAISADTRVTDLARRMADRFVLPVLVAGGCAFALSGQLTRLIAVLIADFGTGVRISVPMSILTTMVAGARSGVLFKRGRAIEELARVDTVVFDKTGTLTEGQPVVVGVTTIDGLGHDECLRLAASAEGHLPHPIARALRRHGRRRGLQLVEPEDVRYLPGGGVRAVVEGHEVLVGDRRLLESFGVEVPAHDRADSSLAFVAVDGRAAGRIEVRDRIKGSAAAALQRLRRVGIQHLVLATGDHTAAAELVARDLGLDEWLAHVMPEDKEALVRRLQAAGRRVAVVGDGMNDASALAAADVGIAVARGVDLARETAEVTLLTEDLEAVVRAVELARDAMRLVRENLGLVAVPNGAALGLAMAGRLSPLAATVVNNGSTVLAAVNALRPLASGQEARGSPDGTGPRPGRRGPGR